MRAWSVVVWGTASQTCSIDAETKEDAERLAIEGFNCGDLIFNEPEFGLMFAEAETDPDRPPPSPEDAR